ncbi:MAG: hypothetical protein K6F63_07970 [Lachnospiraceae bacterium]|nr:hypothetical protein [Lachnospiraceae bacterium]
MLRYCTYCQKDYDFTPREVSGREPLICPQCGKEIPKNSRNPKQGTEAEKSEESIGKAASVVFHLAYIFFIAMGILGIAGYYLGIQGLLWGTVAASVVVYFIQCLTHTTSFPLGVVLLPLGAIAGFFIFKGVHGIGLGIHIVFAIRHLIRDVFYRFIFWILSKVGA